MAENESGFSEAERAAMKQRAEELRSQKGVRDTVKREREFQACLDAIDALTGADKQVAERLHVIVSEEAPELDPKTWYGFPSYAADGDVLVFLQPASKFNTRYPTVGFQQNAQLDDGKFWPTSFAALEIDDEIEQQLRALIRKAVGK